jgi:hypothetical protein
MSRVMPYRDAIREVCSTHAAAAVLESVRDCDSEMASKKRSVVPVVWRSWAANISFLAGAGMRRPAASV